MKCDAVPSVVLAILYGTGSSAAQEPDDVGRPLTTAEVCACLRVATNHVRASEITFDEVIRSGDGVDVTLDAMRLTAPVMAYTWVVAVCEERFRVERDWITCHQTLAHLLDARNVFEWTGVSSFLSAEIPNLPAGSPLQLTIGATEPDVLDTNPFTTWLHHNIDEYGSITLQSLLEQNDVGEAVLRSDGQTEWVFTPAAVPDEVLAVVAVRIDGMVRITGVKRSRYIASAGRSDDALLYSREYYFDWTRSDPDDLIAADCAVILRHGPGHDRIHHTKSEAWEHRAFAIRSVVAHDREPVSTRLNIKVQNRTAVWDDRYRIGYTAGDTVLNLDGRILLTRERIDTDVGKHLAEVVRNGRFPDEDESARAPSLRLLPISSGVLLTGVGIAFAFLLWPKKQVPVRRQLKWCGTILLVFAGVAGAIQLGRITGAGAESTQAAGASTRDFGDFWVDEGARTFEHAFEVRNNYPRPIEIANVVSTCGCLKAEVDKKTLGPDEATTLRIAVKIGSAGVTRQSAVVYFSDGRKYTYAVTARGRVKQDFKAICDSSDFERASPRLDFQFYLMDNTGDGETKSPVIVSPSDAAESGIRLAFDGWATLEQRSAKTSRPTRQIADARLDFSGYRGDFPVDVRFRTAAGRGEWTLRVFGPSFLESVVSAAD